MTTTQNHNRYGIVWTDIIDYPLIGHGSFMLSARHTNEGWKLTIYWGAIGGRSCALPPNWEPTT